MTVLTDVMAEAARPASARSAATERIAATFEIRYRRFLDPAGKPIAQLNDLAATRVGTTTATKVRWSPRVRIARDQWIPFEETSPQHRSGSR